MGRRKKERNGIYDRLGEEVNLEKCPECREHSDCFSCLEGRCTALSVCGGQGCSFYKPKEKAIDDFRDSYRRLKESGRYDLIQKYIKFYTVMGFLDEEIEVEERETRRLDAYRDSDFSALMKQVPGFS